MHTYNAFSATTATPTSYRIWNDAYRLSNGIVEAVVVPAIGRVMQFGWADSASNVLWECDLDAQGRAADVEGWANFGGDKIWPAPDNRWNAVTGRPWPPPDGFDGMPHEARVDGGTLVLTSPVDPRFGIQCVRRITLATGEPVMRISSEFHKLSGDPVETSVWAITQLRHPQAVFALLPEPRQNAEGYVRLMPIPPKGIAVDGRVVSLEREPVEKTKVGFEGTSLLWVGERQTLRIDAPDSPGSFPDRGSRTEVYTNSDPLPYVELETLGPLVTLKAGDAAEWMNTYTLAWRAFDTPAEEARAAFGIEETK